MNKNDLIEKYKKLKAPQSLSEKIMLTVTEIPTTTEKSVPEKNFKMKKTTVAICAAIMLSLVMVVSAVTLYGQNIFLFPSLNPTLFNSENIMYMPEVIDLGNNIVIESIILHEEDGENIFSMVISHSGVGKGSSYGFRLPEENYRNLEISFNDGTSITLDTEGYSGRGGSDGLAYDYFYLCNYEYENFPKETKFTVKNNTLGLSADISLSKPKANNELSVTDNGIKKVNVFSANGSSILSYNVEILRPTLLEADNQLYNLINYTISGDITYKNGNTNTVGTMLSGSDGYKELTDYVDYPRYKFGEAVISNAEREKFARIIINQINASLTTFMPDGSVMPEFVYTVPLPELNGRIEFETPYYLDTIGEFEICFKAIEYKDGKLFIEVAEDGIKYNGFEDVSGIKLGFWAANSSGGGSARGVGDYIYMYEMPIGYPNGDTVDIELTQLSYNINGLWEINFN